MYLDLIQIVLSDYRNDILENAMNNMKFNGIINGNKRGSIMNLDWREYEKFNLKFDFIVGSDIVYDGCPF